MIGEIIKGYKVEELISKSEFANVYIGSSTERYDKYKKVVFKKINPEFIKEGYQNMKFQPDSIYKLIQLSDENLNIAKLIDYDPERSMFIYEFIEGISLENISYEFNMEQKFEIVIQLLQCMNHAERKVNLIHSVINPSNIFISSDGIVKILNFGISEFLNLEKYYDYKKRNRKQDFIFLSPEQIEHYSYNRKSDIYSLALVFFFLFFKKIKPYDDIILRDDKEIFILNIYQYLNNNKEHDNRIARDGEIKKKYNTEMLDAYFQYYIENKISFFDNSSFTKAIAKDEKLRPTRYIYLKEIFKPFFSGRRFYNLNHIIFRIKDISWQFVIPTNELPNSGHEKRFSGPTMGVDRSLYNKPYNELVENKNIFNLSYLPNKFPEESRIIKEVEEIEKVPQSERQPIYNVPMSSVSFDRKTKAGGKRSVDKRKIIETGNKTVPEIGKIDYAIPTQMKVKKAERCIVRIARQKLAEEIFKIREESINEEIRIGDLMSVYLIDPSDKQNFHITSLSTTEQLIKSDEYTEWLFDVTPHKTGKLKLCLKVTITEIVEKLGERKKDVNVLDREIYVKTDKTRIQQALTNKYFIGISGLLIISAFFFFTTKFNLFHLNIDKEKSVLSGKPVKLSPPFSDTKGITFITDSITNESFKVGRYFALIMGVENYIDKNVINLDHPLTDAKSIENVLLTNYTFEKENIFFKPNPTRDTIIKTLQSLEEIITPDDFLLIFYAGHGLYDKNKDQGYWLPKDANYGDPSHWINNQEIRDYLKGIQAKHILLIVDACFAGTIFRSMNDKNIIATIDKLTLEKLKSKSRKAITSGYKQEVPDKSIFLEYLINSLKINTKSYLTGGDLYFMTIHSLEENYLKQHPEKGIKNPQYGKVGDDIDQGGEFIFIRKAQGKKN